MGSILQSGGGLIRETQVPMQELELKMEGGLMCKGGVIAGFYDNNRHCNVIYAVYIPACTCMRTCI